MKSKKYPEFYYNKVDPNVLLKILRNQDIAKALAYSVSFDLHAQLVVTPRDHCILIQNDTIVIAVILYVGFEESEYQEIEGLKNLHLVTFSDVVPEMVEFKDLDIKFIDTLSLLFSTLSLTENEFGKDLYLLKNLNI